MFGDPFTNKKSFKVVRLEELCEELFLGLTSKVDYVDHGGFPLVRATDINKGFLNLDNVKYISESQHKKLTTKRITKRGDVLISKSGTLGTCAIVDTDTEFSTYESIFTVRPRLDLMHSTFLLYLVRNKGFQSKLLGKQVGGTVSHLNLRMFRDFEFPLPPIYEQKRFSERALMIELQKAQAEASLVKAEELFNSLLQKAFKGELTN
jgi:type I restriction enzyme S subunit